MMWKRTSNRFDEKLSLTAKQSAPTQLTPGYRGWLLETHSTRPYAPEIPPFTACSNKECLGSISIQSLRCLQIFALLFVNVQLVRRKLVCTISNVDVSMYMSKIIPRTEHIAPPSLTYCSYHKMQIIQWLLMKLGSMHKWTIAGRPRNLKRNRMQYMTQLHIWWYLRCYRRSAQSLNDVKLTSAFAPTNWTHVVFLEPSY